MANKQQKYNPAMYDTLVWSLASKGFTNEEIAEAMCISERTLLRWRTEHESFGKRFMEGRKIATAQVEESLFKKATGFTVTEEETIIKFDNDGNRLPVSVKSKKRYVVADTTAIIFWLKNRDSANWKDKVEVEETGGTGIVETLVTQIRMMDIEALEKKEKAEKEAKAKAKKEKANGED